eukprot:7484522-Pyramimonas_sp.AAC.1
MPVLAPQFENYTSINGHRIQAQRAYFDGSVNSADARIARGGWGVAFDFNVTPAEDCFPGLYGSIDGQQTVPCAELAALYYCLLYTQGALEIWTDNALVHR